MQRTHAATCDAHVAKSTCKHRPHLLLLNSQHRLTPRHLGLPLRQTLLLIPQPAAQLQQVALLLGQERLLLLDLPLDMGQHRLWRRRGDGSTAGEWAHGSL